MGAVVANNLEQYPVVDVESHLTVDTYPWVVRQLTLPWDERSQGRFRPSPMKPASIASARQGLLVAKKLLPCPWQEEATHGLRTSCKYNQLATTTDP
jgi:hypothetical protein